MILSDFISLCTDDNGNIIGINKKKNSFVELEYKTNIETTIKSHPLDRLIYVAIYNNNHILIQDSSKIYIFKKINKIWIELCNFPMENYSRKSCTIEVINDNVYVWNILLIDDYLCNIELFKYDKIEHTIISCDKIKWQGRLHNMIRLYDYILIHSWIGKKSEERIYQLKNINNKIIIINKFTMPFNILDMVIYMDTLAIVSTDNIDNGLLSINFFKDGKILKNKINIEKKIKEYNHIVSYSHGYSSNLFVICNKEIIVISCNKQRSIYNLLNKIEINKKYRYGCMIAHINGQPVLMINDIYETLVIDIK
jgi:hypothetical protein